MSLTGGTEFNKLKPLGTGLEQRIRSSQKRLGGLRAPSSIVVSCNRTSPITTTQRTWGMPASSNHDFVSYLDTAAILQIASNNVNDSLTGTGLQKLIIRGLDNNWNEISETIEMNGQTPVLTTKEFLRINRLFAYKVGTDKRNLGAIFVSSNDTFTGGKPNTQTLYAMLESDDANNPTNISMFGSYSIPAGHRLWLTKGNYYLGAKESKAILIKEDYIAPYGEGGQRIQYTGGMIEFSASRSFNFDGGGAFDEKTDYNFKVNSEISTVVGVLYYEANLERTNDKTI